MRSLLLRYQHNWQLREKALLTVRQVKNPSGSLLFAVLEVICDRATYIDARIPASQTLAQILPRIFATSDDREALKAEIVGRLLALSEAAEPPVLREAVQKTMRLVDFTVPQGEPQKGGLTSQGEKVWS